MKLFLASQVKHPESLDKLGRFVDGLRNKKIAYIPTAANGEFYGAWKGSESITAAHNTGASIDVIQLEDYCYRDIIKSLRQANILWMAGGMSGYLLYWIRRIELDKALPELLNKGLIYVGSSAGSMICAKTQYSSEWFLDEPEPGASLLPGLGLIDFEIYPHYQEVQLPEIKKRWHRGDLYLLKDGEVITVTNGKINILGEKRVISS